MNTFSRLLPLALLLIIQVGCSKPSSSHPADTVRKLFLFIQEGKVDDATKLCSDKITKDQASFESVKSTFAALTPKIKEQGGVIVEVVNEETTGDTATVTFNLRYGNGQVEPCKYRLIKERGGWKHDGNA